MSYPQVSIIVPVYNTENYIAECITSILQQSFTDFELILVNDGSTDNSLLVCQEWAAMDSRIRLFNIKNRGVGNARNIGIDSARGIWITFIDSDDYIDHDYLQQMLDSSRADVDLIQSGIIFFDNATGRELGRETLTDGLYLKRIDPGQSFIMATMPLITSPVSKLYRRDLLDAYDIRFDSRLAVGEDRDFNLGYLSVISQSCSIAYAGYYYRKGISGNLSSNKDYIQLLNWDIEYCRKLKKYFDTNRCDISITDKYLAHRVFHIYNDRLMQYVNAQQREIFQLIKVLSGVVSQKEYVWLCKHFKSVDCKRMTALVYRSRLPLFVSVYLKILCHKNG